MTKHPKHTKGSIERSAKLLHLFEKSGVSQTRFGRMMGASGITLKRYLNGERKTPGTAITAAKYAMIMLGKPEPITASEARGDIPK